MRQYIASGFDLATKLMITNGVVATGNADSVTFNVTNTNTGATISQTIDVSGLKFNDITANEDARSSAIGFSNINGSVSAKRAIEIVKNKIEDVSKIQGSFGAIESRLNVAVNRLMVDRENFQTAASQITDVDIASESSNLTKTQILQQAAISVLAQANQQPTIALRLLESFK